MTTKKSDSKIILASGSPRRSELLKRHGVDFLTIVTNADENIRIPHMPPEEIVAVVARRKALAASKLCAGIEEAVIIAADTIVYINGTVLGKPKDKEDAFSMLKMLSGNWHGVYTGMCIGFISEGKAEYEEEICVTNVKFKPLTDDRISRYIIDHEPYDKAGAYAVQDTSAGIIEKIDGNYDNVVGLPVDRALEIIAGRGVRIV